MSPTITWSTIQWGNALGANWVNGTAMGLVDNFTGGGGIFSAANSQTLQTASVNNMIVVVEGPLLLGMTLQMDANHNLGFGAAVVLEVGLVPDPRPVAYSDSFLPWSRNEVSLGLFPFSTPQFPAFTPISIVLNGDAMLLVRALVTSRGYWNGTIAFSFRVPDTVVSTEIVLSDNGVAPNAAALVTTQSAVPFFSGLAGGPAGKVRAVRDGRFGMGVMSTELMRDGDQPSLWVRDFDVDPEDPDATYRPKPGEGTTDDEIPNL